ncbi:DUF4129 domain-containing protein [Crenobacter caeni]|uniref:DUF4129 domain-containing protein n=1 Tax=Crenobacter caeni TaxID=2705474 RepID=A0A6B2KR10_9NEIS|nr:DUF4129 domain-containing protein [Crenobacter caeni]NDV12564.1 DUF4129 domain-containing protein [Crenobacter caeni]
MNETLPSRAVYIGLWASLVLAIACNAFLDIAYGSFGKELLCWALAYGWSLRAAWRLRADPERARRLQRRVLLAVVPLALLLFLPVWGPERGGVYALAALQLANSCVCASRRQLRMGLMVSLVLVMFACSHYRADWTLLFYLLPYVAALVFTLSADEIGQRAGRTAPDQTQAAGLGLAMLAATLSILLAGGGLYALTPQPTWSTLSSAFGLSAPLGAAGDAVGAGGGAGQGVPSDSAAGGQGGDALRGAAARPGMPSWQAATMQALADGHDALSAALAPLQSHLQRQRQRLEAWAAAHRQDLLASLLALLMALLLAGLFYLVREMRAGLWLRTRADYLRLGLLGAHGVGRQGARRYWQACERLCALENAPRNPALSVREYAGTLEPLLLSPTPALQALMRGFEAARYGAHEPDRAALSQLRSHYRALYRQLRREGLLGG